MCRILKFMNRAFFVLSLMAVSVISACRTECGNAPAETLTSLLESTDVEFIRQVPLEFDTYHVQGLDLTEQFYFVTSVDRKQNRAWLFKINRQDGHLNFKKDLTEDLLIHPGGMQYDSQSLWVPNAEYRRESKTKIHNIDPNNLQIRRSFDVDDHIGAAASDGKGLLYGVNWDAKHFYTWNFDGVQLGKVASPTSAAYQDIKFYAGKLLCSGLKDGESVIDIIDPKTWTLVKRIDLPRDRWKTHLSREGMAFDGNLYFLPDDGPESVILIFDLR
jgi:glutamine cyclotransferase